MINIDSLKEYGANTEEGLSRCMNNEEFYLKMVGMALGDANFDKLKVAVSEGKAREAFEAAHALKGVTGNLSLTPIYEPLCELTESLRGKDEIIDAGELLDEVINQLEKARSL